MMHIKLKSFNHEWIIYLKNELDLMKPWTYTKTYFKSPTFVDVTSNKQSDYDILIYVYTDFEDSFNVL